MDFNQFGKVKILLWNCCLTFDMRELEELELLELEERLLELLLILLDLLLA